MQISVNGEAKEVADGITIAVLLEELQIRSKFCAVERNRQLVPRAQHADCVLEPDDTLEIVTLVGGG